jgi:hypothetical protein
VRLLDMAAASDWPPVRKRDMIIDQSAPGNDEMSLAPNHQELHRQLLEQFYEDSVDRYGDRSETARAFSPVLRKLDS